MQSLREKTGILCQGTGTAGIFVFIFIFFAVIISRGTCMHAEHSLG